METEVFKSRLPETLSRKIYGYKWQQVYTGCSASEVFRLERAGGASFYLKTAFCADSDLADEKRVLDWLRGKLAVPEVCFFGRRDERDFLLVSAIDGADASAARWRVEPKRVIAELARGLRAVRTAAIRDYLFDARLEARIAAARRNVELGLVDESDFDDERAGRSAASLFRELLETKPEAENLVFTHGDFCLPNVILKDYKISGFVDWARGGVADEYQDVALLARSVAANFGAQYLPFLYERLQIEPDARKIEFYKLLDEFF